MATYGITTYAHEDRQQMTCYYPKREWLEIIKDFEKQGMKKGIDFKAFTISEEEMYDIMNYYQDMDY